MITSISVHMDNRHIKYPSHALAIYLVLKCIILKRDFFKYCMLSLCVKNVASTKYESWKFLYEQFYYRLNNKIDSTAEYLHETSKSTFLRHSFFLSRAKRWGNRKILLECSWQEVSTNHHNVCPERKLIRLEWKLEKPFS